MNALLLAIALLAPSQSGRPNDCADVVMAELSNSKYRSWGVVDGSKVCSSDFKFVEFYAIDKTNQRTSYCEAPGVKIRVMRGKRTEEPARFMAYKATCSPSSLDTLILVVGVLPQQASRLLALLENRLTEKCTARIEMSASERSYLLLPKSFRAIRRIAREGDIVRIEFDAPENRIIAIEYSEEDDVFRGSTQYIERARVPAQ